MPSTEKQRDMVSKENVFTDLAAKQGAKLQQTVNMLAIDKYEERAPTTDDIAALQEATEASERAKLEKTGCSYNMETKLWVAKEIKFGAIKVFFTMACSFGSRKWPHQQTEDAGGDATNMTRSRVCSFGRKFLSKLFVLSTPSCW